MRKTLFVIASLFFSFAYSQTPLKIQQIESLDEIKLYYDSVSDNLNLITIPMEFKVVFNAADSLWISHVYNYAMEEFVGSKDWNSIPLKIKIGDEYLYSVTRYPQQSDTCYYKFISKYFLAPDMDLQDSLSHCIDKMKNEKLNSLSIGTLMEFKKKHSALVDRLLRNDSIGFDVRRVPRKFVEFISFPVEY